MRQRGCGSTEDCGEYHGLSIQMTISFIEKGHTLKIRKKVKKNG